MDEDLVNPVTKLANNSEVSIGEVSVMVNPTIQYVDLNFDEDLLLNDEWLQMMLQKHDIDMMLFSEKIPFESV